MLSLNAAQCEVMGLIFCPVRLVPECPVGRFGANCQLKCSCQNNGSCDKVTGTCQCGSGYYGHLCEHGKNRRDRHT